MKPLMIWASAGAVLAVGQALTTDYSKAGTLRIETTTKFELETTAFSMEVDGEPVDNPRFGAGGGSTEERHVVQIDEFLEQKDGAPSHVRRTFETLSAKGTMTRGEDESEFETECPLEEVTLDLTLDEDGAVVVAVAEGGEPDDAALLEGHALALDLDGLLPDGDVEVGGEWELENEQVRRALGLHVQSALFPRPQRPDEEAGGGGEGGRGGRGGRGFGGGRGGQAARLLGLAEWEGKAKLVSLTADHDGVTCAEISFELECEGEMPEPEFGGGGRGGRGGGGGVAELLASGARVENEFKVEVEGRLLFSLADDRPVLLEIEGEIKTDSTTEREGRGRAMRISSSQEGKFTHVVSVTPGSTD